MNAMAANVDRDRPWIMRTYSGHSSARASNQLYRTNLAKGQTGLSIAFDLPTQIGYDPDSPEAKGEVGKVGVPVVHLGHMKQLLDGIPVDQISTSMTINATAAWLLALYIANAEDRGVEQHLLTGTTQNDIVKEYLSRGTFIFPPIPSRRLIVDMIAYTVRHVPRWNPINVCSYHLQEAGATPVQELAFTMATAIGILDALKESGQVAPDDFLEGSKVIEAKTAELHEAAKAELDEILELGGAFVAIDVMKSRLVQSQTERRARIESGE